MRDQYHEQQAQGDIEQAYAEQRKPEGNRHERRLRDKLRKKHVDVNMDANEMETA